MQHLINIGNFTIECFDDENHSKPLLLAFNGYGRPANDFLACDLGSKYNVVAVNLPFHGNSTYQAPETLPDFTYNHLKILINKILESKARQRFSVLGYSMGGRICLAIIELFAEHIDSAYLFAPDGVKLSRWYKMSKFTIGRSILRLLIDYPTVFFKFAGLVRKAKLINDRKYKFVMLQMSSESKRMQVFNIWITFRNLIPSMKNVRQKVLQHNINLHVFFCKYDGVIKAKFSRRLINAELAHTLHILDTGHNITPKQMNDWIDAYDRK